MKRIICWMLASLGLIVPASAQEMAGTIRIWGNEYMAEAVSHWSDGFRKLHPQIDFDVRLMGSANGMPGIYLGLADVALLGREANVVDLGAFLHLLQYQPLGIEVSNGSLDVPNKSYALIAYVHKDNPIDRLTLDQLDGIFGCEKNRGVADIRKWGDLGLSGRFKDHPINLYGFDAESGTGVFFEHAALHDRPQLHWQRLKEFKDIRNPDGSTIEAGQQIIDALEKDPYGIAISGLRYRSAMVKPLLLARQPGGPFVAATRDTVASRDYPLGRRTYAFINRPPGQAVDPKVRAFLHYVLTQGQQDLLRERDYLPLPPQVAADEAKKLDSPPDMR